MKLRNGKFEKNNDGSNLLELDVGKGVLNSGICVCIYLYICMYVCVYTWGSSHPRCNSIQCYTIP